jgi:uncharacterized protein (DUF1697 family)
MTYVALLRGINVGGHKKVSMTDLRGVLRSLGYTDISTYLQSGNALFSSARQEPEQLSLEIERGIAGQLRLEVRVMIRTPEELAAVVDANPFREATADPTRLHVSFLSAQPDVERLAAIDARQFEPERFHVGDRAIYLWYPSGAGQARLTNAILERRLGVSATARNWNTVTKLLDLARG